MSGPDCTYCDDRGCSECDLDLHVLDCPEWDGECPHCARWRRDNPDPDRDYDDGGES